MIPPLREVIDLAGKDFEVMLVVAHLLCFNLRRDFWGGVGNSFHHIVIATQKPDSIKEFLETLFCNIMVEKFLISP